MKEGAIVQKTNKKSLHRTPMRKKVRVQLLSMKKNMIIICIFQHQTYDKM